MVTDFQHTVSLPQRLLHFIILSICRCYLIRDFFDVAVRIQPQSRQTTSPIRTRKTGVPSRRDVSFKLRIRTLRSILRFPFCQRFISASTPPFFLSAERLPDAAPYRAAPAVVLHSRNIFATMFFVTQPIISHFWALSMQSPCFTW